jgi:HEAT repeat protein
MSGINVWELVEKLNDLERAEHVQGALISLGKSTVPALGEFLLRTPGNLRPRSLAAGALRIIGGQGAFDALVRGLEAFPGIDDPVLALEEEAVENRIAAELKYFGENAALPLLKALAEKRLVAAGESLAELKDKRAIPYLVGLLEDSFKRERASGAILKFGRGAVQELLGAVIMKRKEDDIEPLPSIERRAHAAKLLGLIGDKKAVPKLIELLGDEQGKVRFEAAFSVILLIGERAPAVAFDVIKAAERELALENRLRLDEISSKK